MNLVAALLLAMMARADSPVDAYCARLHSLDGTGYLSEDKCTILRAPATSKQIALVFTAGDYADGYPDIKRALDENGAKASFFLTGDFLRKPEFQTIIKELIRNGHFVGPHSDKHLEPVGEHGETLITHEAFHADFQRNLAELKTHGVSPMRYWITPGESYNEQVARWSFDENFHLFNYSEGTRSNADYMDDDDPHFVSNERIYQSILDREANGGLGGFLLLLHLGVGPGRSKPFSALVPSLLKELKHRGYSFVRVDQLLDFVKKEKP